ncbi:MAG: hypothetical protein L3K17_01540 [Thermoplasmata archaeon]|nr:hypothetical protein [Thermoplasmata archaeon]
MTDEPLPPVVKLPAPVERPMRLGPFPSGRAALKFVLYAAAGALVALVIGPLAWVPFLGVGFLLTAYAPQGRPLDEHVGNFVRWSVRRRSPGIPRRRRPRPPTGGTVARIAGDRRVVVLGVGGVPVSFLPPDAARRLFDEYRVLLRSLDEGWFLRVGTEPLSDRPFRLPTAYGPDRAPDSAARAGYDEMVRLLCRRRRRRAVDVVLWSPDPSVSGRTQLESRARAVADGLRSMGLEPERRQGRSLALAVARVGWPLEGME